MALRHEIRVVELTGNDRKRAAEVAALAWDVAPAPGVMEARLTQPNVRVVAALDREGRVIGATTARRLTGARAVSDETAVKIAWRGQRVAETLMLEMVRLLREDGVQVLEGETSSQRIGELRFFRRIGFRVTGASFAFGVEGYAEGETLFRTEMPL